MPLVVEPETVTALLREGAEPITKLATLLPPVRGVARRPGTLSRWIRRGKNGVRLEGFLGPDKCWWSTEAALGRFFAKLTGRVEEPTPSDAERRRRNERAKESIRNMTKKKRKA